MSCDPIRPMLAAYSEGLLKPDEASKVSEHLSACPACQAEADRHAEVWELLAADEPVEPPADLARRVLEKVRDEGRTGPGRVIRFPTWRRWAASAFAAAAVLLVVGTLVLQRGSKEGPALAGLSEEERQVVANLELLEDYDLLENFDLVENMELLEHQEVVRNL